MNYVFGKRSKEKLAQCHADLQLIANEALKVSRMDFGISEGHRTIEKQQEYFHAGKSKVDGIKIKEKNNYQPTVAFMINEGKITHRLRWGFNWDMDGEIGTDQRFQDMPHFELKK